MSLTLHYGLNAQIEFDLASTTLVAHCAAPPSEGHQAVALVRNALEQPREYPPLAESVVPGDKIVVALEPGVPENDSIVAAVVQCLTHRGANPADITILRTRTDVEAGALDPCRMLAPELRAKVRLATHDPDERGQLGYLANTAKGRPVYLNRALCDADLVVLVSVLRAHMAVAYHGVHGSLYPTFSDARTQQRFRHPALLAGDVDVLARAHSEVDRVGWLMGVPFIVQVVPGADDTLLEVYCGQAEAAVRAGEPRCQAAWVHIVPQPASLVIAALTGGPGQQTWENVGRALATALQVVADDGVIALCTELDTPPGPGLQRLVNVDDPHEAILEMSKQRPSDLLPATELAEALQRCRVYLLSNLDESVVEELGIAAVCDPNDLVRLARRHPTCIALADAQYTLATVAEEN